MEIAINHLKKHGVSYYNISDVRQNGVGRAFVFSPNKHELAKQLINEPSLNEYDRQKVMEKLIQYNDFESLRGQDLSTIELYSLSDKQKRWVMLNTGSITVWSMLWDEALHYRDVQAVNHLNSVLKPKEGNYQGYQQQLQNLARVVTRIEAWAIGMYVDYAAYIMTKMIRGDSKLQKHDEELARQIFYILYRLSRKMTPLKEERVVYRYIDADLVDITTLEHNFSSTSINTHSIERYGPQNGCCLIKAYLQPGIRIIPILGNEEKEIIIPPFNKWQPIDVSANGVYTFKVFQGQDVELNEEIVNDDTNDISRFYQDMAHVLSSEDWKKLMKSLV